ncbi:MAG: QueT transporter family protein [Christensenellaceae bacterium]|jgi:uncharacterized membrane protein
MKHEKIWFVVRSGIIGALYVALTLALQPIGFGLVQLRVSEALTVLPYYDKAAIPGLFVGCLLANLIGGNGIWDIIFGSLATLVAALLTSRIQNKYVALLPPVIINAVVIGTMLSILIPFSLFLSIGSIALGQIAACYGFGLLLMYMIDRTKLFKKIQQMEERK